MYTQCPECKTVFRLSEEQLAAAGGKVRCGHCLRVFTAREHKVERLPNSSRPRPAPAKEAARTAPPAPEGPSRPAAPKKRPAVRPAARARSEETEREIDRLLSAGPLPDPDRAETAAPVKPTRPPAPTKKAANPVRKAKAQERHSDTDAGNGVEPKTEPKPKQSRNKPADSLRNEPERGKQPTSDTTPAVPESDADEIAQQAALHFSATEESSAGEEDGGEPPLPAALRQPVRRGSGPLAVAFWSFASLLMLALLAGQYAYYDRYELVKNPALRPWLEKMCVHLDCRLPPRRDPSAFELQERDVRYHPDYAGALLITGTFVNTAAFAQPYPDVEVLLKDVNGQVVASRRFAPAEYLKSTVTGAQLLSPNTEAQLLLEVSDPGNQAVSFEFKFR
jgi:predicted Zn finger-like uncharacterized protein